MAGSARGSPDGWYPMNPLTTSEVDWRGYPAQRIQGDRWSLTLTPQCGGRIVSILDDSGVEWLIANDVWNTPPSLQTSFTDRPVGGWDEMLPTIDPCTLGASQLPDHGDLWRAPWHGTPLDALTVDAVSLPIRLRRRVSAIPDGFRLSYSAESTGDTVPFLWAAHPLLNAPRGSHIVLPELVTSVVDVLGSKDILAISRPMLEVDSLAPGGNRKLVLPQGVRASWAMLVRGDGHALRLGWDPALIPHLGLYFDACAHTPEPAIAIEPGIGWYDRLDRAVDNRSARWIEPGSPWSWWLDVTWGMEAP
jgi:hypothetical protein